MHTSNYAHFTSSLLAVVLLVAGCQPSQKESATNTLNVVTTTGMIEDAVKNVAGNQANVVSLMGPGVDPHLYKATQGDLAKLTTADVVFYNGLHLEGKMGEVLEKLGRTKTVVAVAGQIPEAKLRTVADGVHDPHIWFNVDLWKEAVKAIATTLSEADTAHANLYRTNASRYLSQLDSLHAAISNTLNTLPPQQRVLITAHDAFGYFGDAYGVEVRGLQGISTVSEFGLRDVTELVNFIIERKIKAIFVETSVSEKSINAVIEGCKEKNWEIKIGGSLYSDAMGQPGTTEGTYVGMVAKNVTVIVEALK
jgi:manganese/zinc/iron transport system substrate-binding protein